jgi:multisubunit Na+/H+ antiporter MnhB subunit
MRIMFKTPDITPAQIVAVVGAVIAVLVAFGVDLSKAQTDAVIQAVSVIAGVLIAGDAVVRHGRSTGNANKQ